jgi:hypothetical protein
MIDVSGWRKRQIMAEDDDDIQDYKKPWVGLTDEEVERVYMDTLSFQENARILEAILKEKNT